MDLLWLSVMIASICVANLSSVKENQRHEPVTALVSQSLWRLH